MPLPVDVKHGTEPTLRGRIGRWLRRAAPPAQRADEHRPATPGVGELSRSYWSARSGSRVAELVSAHEAAVTHPGRPRANPAFSEALFVELMRARQYRRAFDQLSDACKRRWGSAEAFAAAQGSGALRFLQGVRVKDVRYLDEWRDAEAGCTYREVAELDVEYTLGSTSASKVVQRVVHLVPDGGKWRSVCHPVSAA